MAQGQEKSDLCEVATKPANNPGQPGAESVERRQGTEGNAVEPHTRRTQSRASVMLTGCRRADWRHEKSIWSAFGTRPPISVACVTLVETTAGASGSTGTATSSTTCRCSPRGISSVHRRKPFGCPQSFT